MIAGFAAWYSTKFVSVAASRRADLMSLLMATLVWGTIVWLGLKLMKSELPSSLRRKKTAPEPPAEMAEETTGGVEP